MQNTWQTIKQQERQQQREGNEGQTVDYHVDMRHVADVADSRQAGSVLRRIFPSFVLCSFICTGGMWQLPVASLTPPPRHCATPAPSRRCRCLLRQLRSIREQIHRERESDRESVRQVKQPLSADSAPGVGCSDQQGLQAKQKEKQTEKNNNAAAVQFSKSV